MLRFTNIIVVGFSEPNLFMAKCLISCLCQTSASNKVGSSIVLVCVGTVGWFFSS